VASQVKSDECSTPRFEPWVVDDFGRLERDAVCCPLAIRHSLLAARLLFAAHCSLAKDMASVSA
jgi:hypothetical protein